MNRHEIIMNNCIQAEKQILNSMLDAISVPKTKPSSFAKHGSSICATKFV